MRALGTQTFGTDAYLKVHEVIYAGPVTSALSRGLGNTSVELELVSDMSAAKSHRVDLVLWSYSSSKAASTLLRALRYQTVQSGLEQLSLLFVGEPEDAERVRSAIEATGAKFYFHKR